MRLFPVFVLAMLGLLAIAVLRFNRQEWNPAPMVRPPEIHRATLGQWENPLDQPARRVSRGY